MGQSIRRRAASIQLSVAAGALGLLAGIGLGRGTAPPEIEAEPVAKKTITITGSNIVDGSVKYQDLNKASIQKGIYLKAQTDRLFLKLTDADARFHKVITNALGGYIKLGDADTRYLKLDALNGYLKLTDADARFLKLDALDSYLKVEAADGRFLKLDALNGYLKLDAADARFLKLDTADARYLKLDALTGYVKLDDADARFVKVGALDGYLKVGALDGYLKLDALNGYLKLDAADARFLKLDAADALIDKHLTGYVKGETLADYVKSADASARFVEGDGSVVTGSRLVEDSAEPLLAVDRTLAVEVGYEGGEGKGARVSLKNLTDKALSFASTAPDAAGDPQHGTIAPQGTESILIGLLLPATVQIVGDGGDGAAVHTLSVTAFQVGERLQVVGQVLSGAPPAAG
jgi:hypothetical protein